MKRILGRIQLVVLDSPYESFEDPDTQQTLSQTLRLKLKSYQDVYPNGTLPLDTYDFISTHFMVGREKLGGIEPLMVFRTTLLERCEKHRLTFPGLAVLRGSGAAWHASILEEKLREWSKAGERVSYGSGWAIEPALREDRELRNFLKDLMTAMLVQHEIAQKSHHLVACGVPRVHTDRYFQEIGYTRFRADEVELPPFPQASLVGHDAVLLEATRFNARALELAEKFREYWDARLEVGVPDAENIIQIRKKAA